MLAIVIPYYKITFFEATLQSLASQNNQRFKVYIGDDASLENPLVLLERFKGKFDFVYHRFDENLGSTSLTQQWERCIALSGNEEWIMILGDDDVLGSNVVEEFYKNLDEIEAEGINVVRFASQKIDKEGRAISHIYVHPEIENSINFLLRKTRSSLSEYVFKRESVLRIRFKDFALGWFSDVLAVLEFSNFKNVFSLNKAEIYIRISDESISGNKGNLVLKGKATFDFYNYLLSKKSIFFTKKQKQILRFNISKCYINDKKNIFYFFEISIIYLKSFEFKEYIKFGRRIFYSYLRKPCE
jgi:hypothetical protein